MSNVKSVKKKKGYTLTKGIAIAAILGLVAGLLFGDKMQPFQVLGTLFLRLMQMPILLVVLTSIMLAVGALKPRELGRIGGKTIVLFIFTTSVASVFGITSALVFKPGVGLNVEGLIDLTKIAEIPAPAGFTDQLLAFFSSNMFNSLSSGNMLQVLIIAILFGVALSVYGSKHEKNPVLEYIKNIDDIVMQLVFIIAQLLPVAIFSFVSHAVGVMGTQVISVMAKLILANYAAAFGMTVVFISLTALYCKINPIQALLKMVNVIVISFVSASSSVALPAKLEDGVKKLGISPRINNLVAPLGMSMNVDGGVLFYSLGALTVAQVFDIPLDTGQLLNLVITATLLSFGAVTVPGGGLIKLGMVLAAVGLPIEGMVIVSAADFALGPIRVVNNNIDDLMVGMVVAKSEGEFSIETFNQKSSVLS